MFLLLHHKMMMVAASHCTMVSEVLQGVAEVVLWLVPCPVPSS